MYQPHCLQKYGRSHAFGRSNISPSSSFHCHANHFYIAEIIPKKKSPSIFSGDSSTDSSISTAAIESIVEKLKTQQVRDSTKANYYSVWKLFNEFFIKLDTKPTSWEDRLILFVGYLIEQNKRSQTVKSYVSAIRGVLREDGIELNEDRFLLKAITRACKLKNDRVKTRLPIRKGMLSVILRFTEQHFDKKGQEYLKILYQSLFATAYFGLFRIGELTYSPHTIKVTDVNIASNKRKLLFILRSSKTHGGFAKHQTVKIDSTRKRGRRYQPVKQNLDLCPYNLLRKFLAIRPKYNRESEPFFVFSDRSPIYPSHAQSVLKEILKKAGFNEKFYSFHSYRAGRAGDLLKMKISIPVIQELGRWTSNSVYAYLK